LANRIVFIYQKYDFTVSPDDLYSCIIKYSVIVEIKGLKMNLENCLLNFKLCLADPGSVGSLALMFTILCAMSGFIWALYKHFTDEKSNQSASNDNQSVKTGAINKSNVTINQKK
jgi:hypothetical protein